MKRILVYLFAGLSTCRGLAGALLTRVRRTPQLVEKHRGMIMLVLTSLVLLLTGFVAYLTYLSVAGQGVRAEFITPVSTEELSGIVKISGYIVGGILLGTYDGLVFRVDGTLIWEKKGPCRLGDEFDLSLDTKGLTDGPHLVTVAFIDGGRTERISSLPIFVDNTPPRIIVSSPYPNEVVRDDVVVSVEVSGGGTLTTTVLDSARELTSNLIDIATLSEGSHTLTFKAADSAGNVASHVTSFVVDRTPPAIESLGFEEGDSLRGVVVLTPQLREENVHSATWSLDGEIVASGATLKLDTSAYSDGPHAVNLTVVDSVGYDATATQGIVVDNEPPAIYWYENRSRPLKLPSWATLDLSPLDLSRIYRDRKGGRKYRTLSSERVGSIQYFVNGNPTTSMVSLGDYVSDGVVVIEIRVTDNAGNSSKTTLQVNMENSLLSLFSLAFYRRPSVAPQGSQDLPPVPIGVAMGFSSLYPSRMGQGTATFSSSAYRASLGVVLSMGTIFVAYPIEDSTPIGVGVRFRLGGFTASDLMSEHTQFCVELGLAPLLHRAFKAPTPGSATLDVTREIETTTFWANIGLSAPLLLSSPRLSHTAPVNVWITLGCGYSLRESRIFTLTWDESSLVEAGIEERDFDGQLYLFLHLDMLMLLSSPIQP